MSGFDPVSATALTAAQGQNAQKSSQDEAAEGFETIFLTQLVDQMMKTVDAGAFGGEQQAEIWRSFLSEAIAEKLTDQGGLGFGNSVKQVIASYEQGASLADKK